MAKGQFEKGHKLGKGRPPGRQNKKSKYNFLVHKLIEYQGKGGVYLLKSLDRYKIGISVDNLYRRITALHTANAFGIEVVHLIVLPNPRDLEKKLLELFKHKRTEHSKEWFLLNQSDIEVLKMCCEENIEQVIADIRKLNGYLF